MFSRNKTIAYSALLGVIVVFLIGVTSLAQPYSKLLDVKNKAIVTVNDQTLVVDIADTTNERQKGLMHREDMGINEGMLFIFEYPRRPSFWMKNMEFPIDIIWISEGRVIGSEENVPPASEKEGPLDLYSPPELVDRVLEVKAGRAKLLNLEIGDAVKTEPLIPWGEYQLSN